MGLPPLHLESNQEPSRYQRDALPSELCVWAPPCCAPELGVPASTAEDMMGLDVRVRELEVDVTGLEPATVGLHGRCPTSWAIRL